MAVLDPVLVVISGLAELTGVQDEESPVIWTVPDFPFDPSRGTHEVPMTSRVFVDRCDVRLEESEVTLYIY
jgi:hypothetical protein